MPTFFFGLLSVMESYGIKDILITVQLFLAPYIIGKNENKVIPRNKKEKLL